MAAWPHLAALGLPPLQTGRQWGCWLHSCFSAGPPTRSKVGGAVACLALKGPSSNSWLANPTIALKFACRGLQGQEAGQPVSHDFGQAPPWNLEHVSLHAAQHRPPPPNPGFSSLNLHPLFNPVCLSVFHRPAIPSRSKNSMAIFNNKARTWTAALCLS